MLLSVVAATSKVHIEADEIQSAETYDGVNDSGYPVHISEYECHQVEAEQTDQQPVDCTDNNDSKSSTVNEFVSHSYLTFCSVSGASRILIQHHDTSCINICKI